MGTILILEEDARRAFLLKCALKKEGHKVTVTPCCVNLKRLLCGQEVDLVLVNCFLQNDSGWDIYSDLRKEAGNVPVMLYALPGASQSSVNWLMIAVEEGLKHGRQGGLQKGSRPAELVYE